MKRLVFAFAGTAGLALAGCSSNNQDAVQNAELNQPATDVNELANQAAMDAANAEAQTLAAQQQQLNEENAAADNTVNPQEADEQNVSGM
jgi:outer membrane murein-binding lipoprotein Lpp